MADFLMDRPGVWWFAGDRLAVGALLLLGLAASAAMRRRPARAHRVLLLAMVGAIVAPLASQLARVQGWGLWVGRRRPIDRRFPDRRRRDRRIGRSGISRSSARRVTPGAPGGGAAPSRRLRRSPRRRPRSPTVPERPVVRTGPSISLGGVLLASWGLLSGLCLARLVASMIAGAGSSPGPDRSRTRRWLEPPGSPRRGWGSACGPVLRESPHVRCPAIWCWGRRPIILLPERDRAGIARRLGRRLLPRAGPLGAARPLVGAARRGARLPAPLASAGVVGQASAESTERAGLRRLGAVHRSGGRRLCRVAAGAGPAAEDGAGAVGGLEPSRADRPRPAYPRRASDRAGGRPALGVRQRDDRGPGRLGDRPGADAARRSRRMRSRRTIAPAASRAPAKPAEKPAAKRRVDPRHGPRARRQAGRRCARPLAGHTQGPVADLGAPQGSASQDPRPQAETLAEATTDAEGRFEVAADFDPDRYVHEDGFGREPGRHVPRVGLLSSRIKDDATEVTLRLAPQVPIRGRLLTPSGMPAAGVRVVLQNFLRRGERGDGCRLGRLPTT